jgi:hypothetical protein
MPVEALDVAACARDMFCGVYRCLPRLTGAGDGAGWVRT